MKSALLIAVMAAVTLLLRALPFLVLRKRTPAYISYLGRVLPPAIIGMLVIYCLKDITPAVRPFGLPELAAAACVVGMQVWRRSALISILSGTAVYMLLIRVIRCLSQESFVKTGCPLTEMSPSSGISR